ncbi:ACP S-malonyltransferase [uncultured Parvimonas sp.]|uniref:ACP S-malonyltransferase n=1 Tax=uncultured Parvimonas sp. TaxID=747372 RepID=UPI0028D2BF70|nr:ACP S-malonyltransferase [uncultured Parvimonas sp.]
MKIAFLFAGQGAQYVGMGKELAGSSAFKEVFEYLPSNLQKICFEGPAEDLNNTLNAQPCLVAVSLGIAKVLKSHGIDCEYAAGLSLGEYTALAYSDALSVKDVLELVRKRSEIMSNAVPKNTGMAAIFSCEAKVIEDVIKNIKNVEIANYNSPKQIVITGSMEGIDEAILKLKDLGYKSKKLNVSGAFHSSYLNKASEELFTVLKEVDFKQPNKKIVFNTVGKTSDEDVKILLKNQIKSSVKFMQSVEFMIENGVDTFIEIGPGKVLSGLVKQINPDVNIYSVENLESIGKVVELLNE